MSHKIDGEIIDLLGGDGVFWTTKISECLGKSVQYVCGRLRVLEGEGRIVRESGDGVDHLRTKSLWRLPVGEEGE